MNVTLMSGYIATEPTFNTFPKKKKRRGDTRKKGMAANFRISVKRGYMGKDGQKYDYFSCSAYDDSAKYIRRYIQEGDYVMIRAVLKNNNYVYYLLRGYFPEVNEEELQKTSNDIMNYYIINCFNKIKAPTT